MTGIEAKLRSKRVARFVRVLTSMSSVGIIFGLALAAQFFTDLVLARVLPQSDYGQVNFILQTGQILVALCLLGVDQAMPRQLSRAPIREFRWGRLVGFFLPIITGGTLIASLGITFYYRLDTYVFAALWGVAGLGALVQLLASMSRANMQFAWGQVLHNGWRFLLVPVGVWGLLAHYLKIEPVLIAIVVAYGFSAAVGVVMLLRQGQGTRPINLRGQISDGLPFWIGMLSLNLTNGVDRLFIARYLSFSDVATYGAIWNIIGAGYSLLATSVGYVLLPMYVRHATRRVLDRRIYVFLLAVLLTLGVILTLTSPPIIALAYGGRYNPRAHTDLITQFVLVGSLRVFYAVTSSGVGARASSRLLRVNIWISIASVGVLLISSYFLVPSWGLNGAAWANTLSWGVRLVSSLVLLAAVDREATE